MSFHDCAEEKDSFSGATRTTGPYFSWSLSLSYGCRPPEGRAIREVAERGEEWAWNSGEGVKVQAPRQDAESIDGQLECFSG